MPSRILIARRPARSAGIGIGGEPAPIKSMPTIVNKVDLYDYGAVLTPIIVSLHNDDILKYLVYRDPNVDHAEVEKLLAQAQKLDGCEQGLSCPGWQDGESEPFGANAQAARKLRRRAFQHRVDARLMEERLDARDFTTTNEQLAAEVSFFREWNEWRERFQKYLKSTLEDAYIVKGSDFEEMQRFDMELQRHRAKYSQFTHRSPTRSYPTAVPQSSGGIPWGWIILISSLAAGAYFLSSSAAVVKLLSPGSPEPQGA